MAKKTTTKPYIKTPKKVVPPKNTTASRKYEDLTAVEKRSVHKALLQVVSAVRKCGGISELDDVVRQVEAKIKYS